MNDFKPKTSKAGEDYFEDRSNGSIRGFKSFYQNGTFHIEAWIGKVGKEMNIKDGNIIGLLHKQAYYNNILRLLGVLEKEDKKTRPADINAETKPFVASEDFTQYQVNDTVAAANSNQQPTTEIESEIGRNNEKSATISFGLALISLVGIMSQWSFVFNLASYTLAFNYGLKSKKRNLAIAAIVLNSIVLLITVIRLITMFF